MYKTILGYYSMESFITAKHICSNIASKSNGSSSRCSRNTKSKKIIFI